MRVLVSAPGLSADTSAGGSSRPGATSPSWSGSAAPRSWRGTACASRAASAICTLARRRRCWRRTCASRSTRAPELQGLRPRGGDGPFAPAVGPAPRSCRSSTAWRISTPWRPAFPPMPCSAALRCTRRDAARRHRGAPQRRARARLRRPRRRHPGPRRGGAAVMDGAGFDARAATRSSSRCGRSGSCSPRSPPAPA